MAVRGYVLIETDVGKAKAVADAVLSMDYIGGHIVTVDAVTGPYDVIVQLAADDLDRLGNAITQAIQQVGGVQRTTTCLAIHLD